MLLDIFSIELDDIKVSFDVNFNTSNSLEVKADVLKEIALEKGFIQNKNNNDSYRRFKVKNKYNLTENIEIVPYKRNMVNTSILFGVDNIVLNFEMLYEQLMTAVYFYMRMYCKLHYEYIKAVDEEYIEKNANFYKKLEKLTD